MVKKRSKKKGFNWKAFVLIFIIVFAVSFVASLFTGSNTKSSWYLDNKPSFTPPNIVFPIVWPVLYALIALSLYFSWSKADKEGRKKVELWFGLNLFFNLIWSLLFFTLKVPVVSFIDIILMIGTGVMMAVTAGKIDRKAGWMLAPYIAWISFASILNLGFFV